MEELISVIIPTYKRPEKLLRTIKSVVSQTYTNFEVLVINDDVEESNLLERINELKDGRIKLLKNQRTKGANGARNTGIINASGRYIAFLDDDDEWMTNYLETQVKTLKNTNEKVGLVYGGYLLEKKSKWTPVFQKKEGNLFADIILDKLFIGASSNIFIKEEIIKKVGLWDEDLARQQDLEFLIRVFKYFEVVYNPELILKVYGHNDPKPEKSFHSREEFLTKVLPHLNHFLDKQKALFYSNHYRRQAGYLLKMKSYNSAKECWLKAFKNKKIAFKKDIKLILIVLNIF